MMIIYEKMNRICLRIKSHKKCEGGDNNGMYVCVDISFIMIDTIESHP